MDSQTEVWLHSCRCDSVASLHSESERRGRLFLGDGDHLAKHLNAVELGIKAADVGGVGGIAVHLLRYRQRDN